MRTGAAVRAGGRLFTIVLDNGCTLTPYAAAQRTVACRSNRGDNDAAPDAGVK